MEKAGDEDRAFFKQLAEKRRADGINPGDIRISDGVEVDDVYACRPQRGGQVDSL